ncbi:hypothetical protein DFJ63DRAFT_159516 [Scheffersomyces coipomensis]|uniref:uncharacterized protein n=1 Tax=Scheffersomyces coipomensis TaxID=1788519 RepID=UPI00315DDCFA
MSNSEKGTSSEKEREAESERKPEYDTTAPPPAYEEIATDYNRHQQAIPPPQQQQYHSFPPNSGSSYAPPPVQNTQVGYNYNPPPQTYNDPLQDPNVYRVPADIVNITQTMPHYLNPSYQQYLERDQQRIQQGNFPNPNGPLNTGTQNPTRKGGSGFFPGKSGVTYNNAANK